jgi:hypothetical protein
MADMNRASSTHFGENRSAWGILVENSSIFETVDGFSRIFYESHSIIATWRTCELVGRSDTSATHLES